MNYELIVSAPALGFWEWLRVCLCGWAQPHIVMKQSRIVRVCIVPGQTIYIGRACDVRRGGKSARHKHPANVFCQRQEVGTDMIHLCCLDPFIFKYHATLCLDHIGVFTVRDRGSKSGVRINGARVLVPYVVYPLTANDWFECGLTRFMIVPANKKLSTGQI